MWRCRCGARVGSNQPVSYDCHRLEILRHSWSSGFDAMPFVTRLKCALWIVAIVVLGSASLARDGAFFDGTAVERVHDLGVVPPFRGGLESHYRYLSLRASDS